MVKNLFAKCQYLIFATILFLFYFFFGDRVSAATLTSYGTYTGNTNNFTTCGYANTYSYTLTTSNVQGGNLWTRGNIGSTISGKAYDMSFLFKTGLTAQKTYDVTINMNNSDFTNRLTANRINLFNGSACDNMYNNDISLISFTNKATSSSNTSSIKFRIYANSIITWWGFTLKGDNKNITSVNNFGVKSITLTEVDTSGNNQVIENNNNNTNNIINNQNQTTQELIENQNQNNQALQDNINDKLGNKCENLLNIPDGTFSNNGVTAVIKNGIITLNGTATETSFIVIDIDDIAINGSYILKLNNSSTTGTLYPNPYSAFRLYKNGSTSDYIESYFYPINSKTNFNGSYNLTTINIRTNAGLSYNNFVIKPSVSTKDISFCEFGTYSSKLDDVNSGLNDVNNSINNSSVDDPSSTFDTISSFLPDNGVITQLITLPITLFQKVLNSINGVCSPFSLGNLFGTELVFPCINIGKFLGSFLWTTIDVIISGMFVYKISRKFIKIFDSFTSLREGDLLDD